MQVAEGEGGVLSLTVWPKTALPGGSKRVKRFSDFWSRLRWLAVAASAFSPLPFSPPRSAGLLRSPQRDASVGSAGGGSGGGGGVVIGAPGAGPLADRLSSDAVGIECADPSSGSSSRGLAFTSFAPSTKSPAGRRDFEKKERTTNKSPAIQFCETTHVVRAFKDAES